LNLYVPLATLAAVAAILALAGRIPRRALIVLGFVFIAAGVGALAMLEWRFAPSRTQALSMPLPLAAADARIASKPFTLALTAPFDVSLQVDRGDGVLEFGCLTAEPGFEGLCFGREPELDVSWIVSEAGARIAGHASDVPRWKMRRAAIDPATARARLVAFHAYADHAQEPSNQTPLYHSLGAFDGIAGRTYKIEFRVNRAAPDLANLHPRVIVGLSAAETQAIGRTFLAFTLLCVGGGAFMLLRAFARTAS
jgi:hypothetical protein